MKKTVKELRQELADYKRKARENETDIAMMMDIVANLRQQLESDDKTELEKALEYFSNNGVMAYVDDGSLRVIVGDCHIQVSSDEVSIRAELYDEQD